MSRYKEFWYNSWRGMISRCENPKASNYKYYGAKGIKVCDEWHNPDKFKEWAENSGWFKGATIDRIDANGNYEPSNCRWASKSTQAINRSSTVFIEAFGEKHNLTEWASILGINKSTLINRYNRGDRGIYLLRHSEHFHSGWTWNEVGGKRLWLPVI